MLLLVVFRIISLATVSTASPFIFESPENTTVCLNTTAVFHCLHNGSTASWTIDRTDATSFTGTMISTEIVGDGRSSVSLSVPVLTTETKRIQCTSIITTPTFSFVDSDEVFLFVQGPPSPPSGLTATPLNETSIKLSWSAPPDVLDEGLISYLVEVRNESGGLVLSETVTDTEYLFTTDNPDPCHLYSFTVTSLCDTVQGERSESEEFVDSVPSIGNASFVERNNETAVVIAVNFSIYGSGGAPCAANGTATADLLLRVIFRDSNGAVVSSTSVALSQLEVLSTGSYTHLIAIAQAFQAGTYTLSVSLLNAVFNVTGNDVMFNFNVTGNIKPVPSDSSSLPVLPSSPSFPPPSITSSPAITESQGCGGGCAAAIAVPTTVVVIAGVSVAGTVAVIAVVFHVRNKKKVSFVRDSTDSNGSGEGEGGDGGRADLKKDKDFRTSAVGGVEENLEPDQNPLYTAVSKQRAVPVEESLYNFPNINKSTGVMEAANMGQSATSDKGLPTAAATPGELHYATLGISDTVPIAPPPASGRAIYAGIDHEKTEQLAAANSKSSQSQPHSSESACFRLSTVKAGSDDQPPPLPPKPHS